VLDVGREGRSYFYTMEYVHGRNLRDVLTALAERDEHLALDAALTLLQGAAAGLHAAHELTDRHGRPMGIVHRDVSPSNLMIAFDGGVKVVDFGVATAADRITETRSGAVKGKIAYLSPEQCKLRSLDRRSDVFALGIVAFELLTRRRLFRRDSDYDTMHAILTDEVPPPSELRGDLPVELDAVVLRALARDRDRRFATTAAMRDALERVALRHGIATGPAAIRRAMHDLFGDCPPPAVELRDEVETGVVSLAALEVVSGEQAARLDEDRRPTFRMRAVEAPPPSRWPSATDVPITSSVSSPVAVAAFADPPSSSAATAAFADPPSSPAVAPPLGHGRRRRAWPLVAGAAVIAGVAMMAAIEVAPPAVAPDTAAPAVGSTSAGIAARAASPGVAAAPVTSPAAPVTPPAAPVVVAAPASRLSLRTELDAIELDAIELEPAPQRPTDVPTTSASAPARSVDVVAATRARASTAARRGEWRAAYRACREGLAAAPRDVELLAVCGQAACVLGKAQTARTYIAALPPRRAAEVERRCLAGGTLHSPTECVDDPFACR
jgi:serine/threonine-protein kinase